VYEQYRQSPNVAFYAVGGPWGDDTVEKESAFAKQIGLNLPLAFGSPKIRQALGVGGFPALIILDRAGHVRLIHSGYDASEHLALRISKYGVDDQKPDVISADAAGLGKLAGIRFALGTKSLSSLPRPLTLHK